MKPEELELLKREDIRRLIESHLDSDPREFAFRHAREPFPVAPVATQLKCLQKARAKLPSWFAVRCILPPRAFGQATSGQVAAMKPFGTGARALDLTCGLGVDAVALAARYDAVVALEPDPVLYAAARYNLDLLGVRNITLHNTTAEQFLRGHDGPPFDLLYVDPDRRDGAGQRVFRFADCRPDATALLPAMRAAGSRVLIKAAPMLDIDEAVRDLGAVRAVTVLAHANECKELLFEAGPPGSRLVRGVIFTHKGEVHRFETDTPPLAASGAPGPDAMQYVYEADVSLYKAGLVPAWWRSEWPDMPGGMAHADGYFFSERRLDGFPGRAFAVRHIMTYKPGFIRKYLKEKGIRRANLSRRHFDLPLRRVQHDLRILNSGEDYLLFTRFGKTRLMIHAARIG